MEQSQTCSGCYGWERLQPKWHKTGFHQDRCGHQRQTRDIAKVCLLFIQAFWCCREVIDRALVLSVLYWKAPIHSRVLDITDWQRRPEDVQLGCLSKYQDCCGTNYIVLTPADGHVSGSLLSWLKKIKRIKQVISTASCFSSGGLKCKCKWGQKEGRKEKRKWPR